MKSMTMNLAAGLWMLASVALAGQAKTSSPACYEGGPQGKAVPTVKTQEECQKLGDKFAWVAVEHKHHSVKGKEKGKQAKAETPDAAVSQPSATPAAAVTTPPVDAPKK